MAYHEKSRAITAIAGTAVTRGRFVVIASDLEADHAASAQGYVDGICGMDAEAGEAFPMNVPDGGVSPVEAGAAVTAGALVATDASGRAIAWVDSAGNVAVGKALGAASAAGTLIPVQFAHKRTGAGS